MDRTSHNESLIICASLQIMVEFEEINIAKLDILLVLCIDHAIRNRLLKYKTYHEFILNESKFEMALNRKFIEYQPCILNALTMMLVCGIIENADSDTMLLTKKGNIMAGESADINNDVMDSIFEATLHCKTILGTVKDTQIYKDLGIVL